MKITKKMKRELLQDYVKKYEALENISFKLYRLGYEDLCKGIIEEMAGLKLLIECCENINEDEKNK